MDGVRGKRETKRIGNGMAGVRACGGGGGGGGNYASRLEFFLFFFSPTFRFFFFLFPPLFFLFWGSLLWSGYFILFYILSLLSSRFVLLVFARSFGFFVLCRFPSKNKSFL